MCSRFILLSELDALGKVPGFRFNDNDRICIIPVCCRSPLVTNSSSFSLLFGATGDKGKRFRDSLVSRGAKEECIFYVDYYDPCSYLNQRKILNSQYIILPGGLMELGVKRLKETRLNILLSRFRGTIISFSAGGIMLFDKYITIPNPVYKNLEMLDGIGLLDSNQFVIDVHFDNNNNEQVEWLKKATAIFHKTIYAIEQDGFIVIDDNCISNFSGVSVFTEDTKGMDKHHHDL